MIDTREVIEYFDRLAPGWDAGVVRNEAVIREILDKAGVRTGARVLDVACGTGVLIPDYLRRGAARVVAVDISPEMARIAREKSAGEERVEVLCADAQALDLPDRFDCILVYNAFPHFSAPEKLLENLTKHLCPGGRLTVAHGMSRERVNEHHRGDASRVSRGLMPAEELAALLAPFLQVDEVFSNDSMYLVSGTLS